MFKVFFWELSKRQLEVLGQITAVSVGSAFSPWYPMLKHILAPYADLGQLMTPNALVALHTYLQMVRNMKAAGSYEITHSFLPSLWLCAGALMLFLVLCNFIGLFATRFILGRVANTTFTAGQAS